MGQGLRGATGSPAAPPYRNGPFTWDQQVTFTAGLAGVNSPGLVIYVDGTSGDDNNDGKGWSNAMATIQAGVTAAGARGTVFVAPLEVASGATDPSSYVENVIIAATHEGLSIIGVNTGRTQGGVPQLKVGTTTTQALLTVRAPNCLISGIGFNGSGATGGGITLDDNGSTKTAFGTSIIGCHFKNCVGTTATNAATGGAIQWAATGGAWQVLIQGNRFYKNAGDIVLLGTSESVPQDVVIEDNVFSGPAANVDCQLYLAGGSGMNGVIIQRNVFSAFPAIGSGTNLKYAVLTSCIGVLADNYFGANGKTFKVSGTGAEVPTTVLIAGNWQEVTSAGGTTSGEFGRAS